MVEGKNFTYEVIIVDDGSTDGTNQAVQKYQQANPRMPIILRRNPRNRGLGYNYLHSAKQARGRYYMLVNGDNDIPARDLALILEGRDKADLCIPYLGRDERPLFRQAVSKIFTFVVNLIAGHKLRYYNGPVLHLRENVVRFAPNTRGYAYQAELLCRALRRGCTYIEIPFHSKMKRRVRTRTSAFRLSNIFSVCRSLLRVFRDRVSNP